MTTDPTTRKITITVTRDMSKEQEIAVMHKLADGFRGMSSYLEDFFTNPLIDWVSQQIGNDFVPDLWGTHLGTFDHVTRLEKENRELRGQIETQAENLAKKDGIIAMQAKTIEDERRRNRELYGDFSETHVSLSTTREELERAQEEIIRLKAKLYDLMTK